MRLPIADILPAHPPTLDTGPQSIRAVRVLRISVTDRCNLRCTYCMPEEGVAWLPKDHILSFEEIEQIVRAAVDVHGITRFKLTGGEPTVRQGLIDLVGRVRRIPGVQDLSLTTNGILLPDLARPLRDAGLDRVTISLDSLRPDRFRAITKTGDLADVLKGLDAAERAGFASIKLNCVTMRGTNDDEFPSFASLTLTRPLTVRFIEYMPLGDAALLQSTSFEQHTRPDGSVTYAASSQPGTGNWELGTKSQPGTRNSEPGTSATVHASELGPSGGCGAQDRGATAFIPESEVRALIEQDLGPLVPVDRATEPGVGPAIPYRLARGNPKGRIAFISAMSEPFCATCNRLRLTADGILRSCLFEGGEVDTRPILRDPATAPADLPARLAQAMTDCVRLKPTVHSAHGNQHMSRIGG